MAKVRTKKEHKKRVAKRNNILLQEKIQMQKAQKAFLLNLIEEERKKGLFDNDINSSNKGLELDLPTVGSTDLGIQQGPQI